MFALETMFSDVIFNKGFPLVVTAKVRNLKYFFYLDPFFSHTMSLELSNGEVLDLC